MNRDHPVTPDILRTADSIREALHLAPSCCANHAAETCIIAAASFAADVAKGDQREMRRFFDALSNYVFGQIRAGKINFRREQR